VASAHITASQVQAWFETTKLTITSLDTNLEAEVSTEVLGYLTETYAEYVPAWIDASSTPAVVQKVIAMMYAGWAYDRAYSEVISETPGTSYGLTLRTWATALLTDIIRGAVAIAEIEPNQPAVAPVFYPNDASSTYDAVRTNCDPNDISLGPEKFGVSKVF
jgi:hypothetical protein